MAFEPPREDFDSEVAATLRARFVVDRVDGQPLLRGHAECPHCSIRLRPEPTGVMELHDDCVRIRMRVSCLACGRGLPIVEEFEKL